ncbi:MAG: diguanylate cyclase, partial [Candidatus Sumerlaeaceae bacterium]
MTYEGRLIAIVDDNADNREILRRRLERRGFRVITFSSGEELLAKIEEGVFPALILLDLMMPGLGGLGTLARLRQNQHTRDTPVIMVSAAGEDETIVRALREGANDYVLKPVNFEVLLARIETHLRIRDALETIRAQRDMMEALALLDPLTGVYNRRALEGRLRDEFERACRYRRPLSLIFFDLDHFKRVNDRYGHDVGDEVLRSFARRLQEFLRTSDIVARYGGEEFCVILPETEEKDAFAVAQRIREAVASAPCQVAELALPVTVSGGVAAAK